jgi:hypothetical protein
VLAQLAKYASVSAQLRQASLEKRAGVLGGAMKTIGGVAKSIAGGAGKAYSGWAKQQTGMFGAIARNPGKAFGTALGVGAGVPAAIGKQRQYKAGFDPAVQQAMMGQTPRPPGA